MQKNINFSYNIERSIPECFEEQVQKYPNRIAVKSALAELSYSHLNEKSNRLAHGILSKIGEKEEAVALLLDKDIAFIEALLGSLKAGKFYIPVDPQYPADRISMMLQNSQASLVITDYHYRSKVREIIGNKVPLVCIEEISESLSSENPGLKIEPNRFACVYYTSGSTGIPKGAINTHLTAIYAAMAKNNIYSGNFHERISLLTSSSFGSSRSQIMNSLFNGATLFLYNTAAESFQSLAEHLKKEEITMTSMMSSFFRTFLDVLKPKDFFPHLRLMGVGGEALYKSDIMRFWNHVSRDCILRHNLSSSETNTIMCNYITRTTELSDGPIPLTVKAKDKEISLLDTTQDPPIESDEGEIVIRSRYLAHGYWRNEELTKKTFQFCEDGTIIYRTGDMGKRLPDGSILHSGRKDNMVKIAGFRVELGEVEKTLYSLESISQAIVIAKKEANNNNRLVAYIVLKEKCSLTSIEIRKKLEEKLPYYMIPAVFVFLKAMPLNVHGKIDRSVLPEPSHTRHEMLTGYEPPRNEMEEKLAIIWQEVLEIYPIGVHDNFFELGGTSLLAQQVLAKIEKYFGKNFSLSRFWQLPTIELLASAIAQGKNQEDISCILPLQTKGTQVPIFFITTLNPNFFVHLIRYLGQDQPCYGLHLQGERFTKDFPLEEVASIFIREIKEIQPQGPYFFCGTCLGGIITFEMAQQLSAQGEKIPFLALMEMYYPEKPQGITKIKRGIFKKLKILRSWTINILRSIRRHSKAVYGMTFSEFKEYIKRFLARKKARSLNRPRKEHYEKIKHFVALAAQNYIPKEYKDKIVFFVGRDSLIDYTHGSRNLWFDRIEKKQVYTIPGDHKGIEQEPNVQILAEHFKRELALARNRKEEKI